MASVNGFSFRVLFVAHEQRGKSWFNSALITAFIYLRVIEVRKKYSPKWTHGFRFACIKYWISLVQVKTRQTISLHPEHRYTEVSKHYLEKVWRVRNHFWCLMIEKNVKRILVNIYLKTHFCISCQQNLLNSGNCAFKLTCVQYFAVRFLVKSLKSLHSVDLNLDFWGICTCQCISISYGHKKCPINE